MPTASCVGAPCLSELFDLFVHDLAEPWKLSLESIVMGEESGGQHLERTENRCLYDTAIKGVLPPECLGVAKAIGRADIADNGGVP